MVEQYVAVKTGNEEGKNAVEVVAFILDRNHMPDSKKPEKIRKPSYLNFDKDAYPWKADIDYRVDAEKYRIGKGEQGVLICQPYKGEIVQHWHFKTPEIARESSKKIYEMFETYLKKDDFVGADMARKFLQMGYTRARRYTNYKGGVKYDKDADFALKEKGTGDPLKAESAEIFHKLWKKAEANSEYAERKKEWKARLG